MDPKLAPAVLMAVLSAACIIVILAGLYKLLPRTGWDKSRQQKIFTITTVSIVIWVTLVGALAIKGFFSDFSKMPPKPVLAIFLPMPVLLIIAFSKAGGQLLRVTPSHWLTGVQAFRILVELLLWRAVIVHIIPVQMSFEGYNFDVFSGVLGLIVAIVIKKNWSPVLVTVYNIVGLLLLINILVIALLSMPTPFRYFMNEPSNTLVGTFPFIYLPAVLVVIAYGFHIFSLRQVWLLRKQQISG